MKLAMTLLVRDEEDVIESHLAFHLNAGVDLVIVTDNGSVDDTPAILERYARKALVHVIHEPAGEFRQREWVTRMARLAATQHGADWVINSDADEFWWPRGGSLKEVLETIPQRYGIVQSFVRHFVPVIEDEGSPFERMVYRLSPQAPVNDPTSPWRPFRKAVHRAAPDAVVMEGAHGLVEPMLRPLRGWYPIEVLHFPVRSAAQLARKGAVWQSAAAKYFGPGATQTGPGAAYHALAYRASEERTSDEYYASLVLDGEERERALAAGVVQVDTRLRDVLRRLRDGGDRLVFARPSVVEDALYAVDVAALGEADVIRTQRRLDGFEGRLAMLEATFPARLERKLRALAHQVARRGGAA